jgi:hypothetical protein
MSALQITREEAVGGLRVGLACAAAVFAIVCIGCGPTTSAVNGRVTMDGRPLTISDGARGTVVFHPAGGQGATATGLLDRAGSFRLGMGASSNIVPGRYQVAISAVELVPAAEGAEARGKRVTPAKYSSAIDSGLQADVALGENDFTFELSSAEDQPVEANPPAPIQGDAPVETQAVPESGADALARPKN